MATRRVREIIVDDSIACRRNRVHLRYRCLLWQRNRFVVPCRLTAVRSSSGCWLLGCLHALCHFVVPRVPSLHGGGSYFVHFLSVHSGLSVPYCPRLFIVQADMHTTPHHTTQIRLHRRVLCYDIHKSKQGCAGGTLHHVNATVYNNNTFCVLTLTPNP